MSKSTRKKKDKAADFSKVKLKLGKGKQVANNAVDTSFKARSIALPGQSIVQDRDSSAPATKRKLTINDLLSQLKHYNPMTRRDAIAGLRELFSEYHSLAVANLTTVLNRCVRVITDEDASVRKALLSFFAWFISLVPKNDLEPHASVLLLFTTSALTHIFPEIRVDAVRFLDILIEHIPEVVVEGWTSGAENHGRRVLEGYLGLLNAGTAFGGEGDPMRATSTASVVLSPKSKLVVLSSLSSFLNEAMIIRDRSPSQSRSTSSSIPTWFFASSFASESAFRAFSLCISPTQITPDYPTHTLQCLDDGNPTHDGDFSGFFDLPRSSVGDNWTLEHMVDIDIGQLNVTALPITSSNDEFLSRNSYAAHLANVLQPTLLSTFLDCAPSAFLPASASGSELKMILVVAKLARSLHGGILQDQSTSDVDKFKTSENLSTILGYMLPYFPFCASGCSLPKRDIKVEFTFETLNLIFCELTSLLVFASPASTRRPPVIWHLSKPSPSTLSQSLGSPLPMMRVQDYVTRLLKGEFLRGSNTQNSLPCAISHAAYSALVPTIWALINSTDQGQTCNELLIAVVDHALSASSVSAAKRGSTEFLGLLALLCTEPQYRGAFTLARSLQEDQKLKEWLLHLPQVLWEIGGHNLPATEIALRLLLRLSQRKSVLLDASTSTAIRARLVPYFMITHATRGKLPGPFAKLPPPSAARRLALNVAAVLPISTRDTDDLVNAVGEAVMGSSDEMYWRTIILYR